jgi:hypothetical protein
VERLHLAFLIIRFLGRPDISSDPAVCTILWTQFIPQRKDSVPCHHPRLSSRTA